MPSISTYGSPSITMRSEKVPESPSSALQTTYLTGERSASTVRHLMPVGNAAPPRPRRPESSRAWTAARRLHGQRVRASPRNPSCCAVLVQRQRVGEADAGEGPALLAGEVGNALRSGHGRARGARRAGNPAANRPGTSCTRDRTVGDAAVGGLRPRPAVRATTCRASRCARARSSAPRCAASRAMAAATASAPTDSAPNRGKRRRGWLMRPPGTGATMASKRWASTRPTQFLVVDQHGRRAGAIAQAVHRFERDRAVAGGFVQIDAQRLARVLQQPAGTHRLAGLGNADANHMASRRRWHGSDDRS